MENFTQTDDETLHKTHCKGYKYYPLILPAQKRIIVIGDLHGDFDLTIRALQVAKVIDNNYNWIGGQTIVVQVGDQVDSCRPWGNECGTEREIVDRDRERSKYKGNLPEDIGIMEFLNDLSEKANKVGGGVISLLGNHELMNVNGNMSHVSYEDLVKLSRKERINAFKPGNKYAKLLACSRLPAIIIGSFIFVHAGFIEPFVRHLDIEKPDDLYKISGTLKQWLLGIIDKNNVIDIITSSKHSMFWNRILGVIPPNMNNNHPDCRSLVNKVLTIFKVKGMMIGHTPQFLINEKGINTTCENSLWRVDFGGSFGFHQFDNIHKKNGNIIDLNRDVQVLEILDDKKINILKMN